MIVYWQVESFQLLEVSFYCIQTKVSEELAKEEEDIPLEDEDELDEVLLGYIEF